MLFVSFNRFQYLLPEIGHVFSVIRRNKVIGNNYGLLYRDVAFLPKEIYKGRAVNGEFKNSPTICIEIKAKQGYMMDDDDGECNDVKKCRYCYFQVKVQTQEVQIYLQFSPPNSI